jgi:hypothetical protein
MVVTAQVTTAANYFNISIQARNRKISGLFLLIAKSGD